jgi:uncharacterized membrane protein YjgN (DUF898 family)
MGEGGYRVIYKGEILEGFEKQAVLREVAGILAIDEQAAARLINGERRVLGKGLDEPTARGRCMQLKRAGLRMALGVPQNGQGGAAGRAPDPSIGAKASSPAASRPRTRPVASAASEPLSAEQPERAVGLPSRVPFEFRGSGSEYFRIWIVNILLSIMTLGIYSAWAKVRNRSYFYGNTRVHGAAFEYLASPKQILKGRAIVGGALIVYSLISSFLPFVQLVFLALFIFAFPWLVIRALAFNARHSAWRNIRFGFRSSYKEAFKVYTLWPALALLTLGALAPYAFYRQRRFLVENSSFGRTRFSFQATWRDYYRIFMVLSLGAIAALALIVGAVMVFPPLAVLALPLYLLAFAYFAVKSGNLLYNASRLGGHRLASVMEVKGYARLVLTNTLLTALTVGFYHPWAKVRTADYRLRHLSLVPSGDLEGFVAAEQTRVGALGDASADFFDFDFGL